MSSKKGARPDKPCATTTTCASTDNHNRRKSKDRSVNDAEFRKGVRIIYGLLRRRIRSRVKPRGRREKDSTNSIFLEETESEREEICNRRERTDGYRIRDGTLQSVSVW